MKTDTIRNFSIIAHIDHGKSTLADRMLEVTKTVEERRMRDQVLDEMELERERGITIKMTPARMQYAYNGSEYTLNLIDTPGHIDFAYEVSRALKAVEGAILLVDATQGVQAQTLSTLAMARELGLVIIPVVTKIDAPHARVTEITQEIVKVLGCRPEEVCAVSGKTGEGVSELLETLIERIPPPEPRRDDGTLQALIFDFAYSEHRGVVVYIRVFSGELETGSQLSFCAAHRSFGATEIGVFVPEQKAVSKLGPGEAGYIVTGIKEPGVAKVGDTVTGHTKPAPALEGYRQPKPVVWASVYPESQDEFNALRQALERLQLTDSSVSFEEESSSVLGRGFRCGFLGMLHLEIVTERLKREFDIALLVTTPTVTYAVTYESGETELVRTPSAFPDHGVAKEIQEPWASATIMTPSEHMGSVLQLLYQHEAEVGETETFGDGRISISAQMPLRELMRGFFDSLKSASSGFASLSYEIGDMHPADVVRLDVLVADEEVPAFARIVSRRRVQEESEWVVARLKDLMPRQLFVVKLQARALGRIVAAERIAALKKDVTGHLYGGDVTRKRKLWEKQKKGKKRMRSQGKVSIPQEVFTKMLRSDEN